MLKISPVPMVSQHFSAGEMMCPHCGIIYVGEGMRLVLEAAEIVRTQTGRPVNVPSGSRCPVHNAAVGGAPNSRHLYGDAMDVYVNGVAPKQLREIVRTLCPWIHGIGVGASKFHMDARPGSVTEWQYK